jgi:L-gulonolactone oxidase
MPSQLTAHPSDIPLNNLYNLLQPITVPSDRTRFTNWGRSFTCTPSAIFEPENEFQCELVLELARREGKSVRVAAVGHSPNDLACTSQYMLRTTKLNRVLEVINSHLCVLPGALTYCISRSIPKSSMSLLRVVSLSTIFMLI